MPLYRITQQGLTAGQQDRHVEMRFNTDAEAKAFAVGSVLVQRIESLALLDDILFDTERGTGEGEP